MPDEDAPGGPSHGIVASEKYLTLNESCNLLPLESDMVKMISRVGRGTRRCLVIAGMASVLTACGGSSGDTVPLGDQDFDNDDIINSLDPDADGDLILDSEDNFVDLDLDGFDDRTGETEAEANASDVPGDEDNDGFTDVSETNQCGSENGTDNNSSTATWDDNCVIKRSTVNGQFADSLYSVGVQRVAFCTGFGTGDDYTAFADGEYGPGSEAAVQAFQRAEGLTDDGIVGPQTWARLQARVEVLTPGVVDSTPDAMGFSTGACAGIPMFYQFTTASGDGLSLVRGGWELAKNQPNADQRLPFSIGSPFNQLD